MYGGALIVAATYWFLSARHFFKGPVRPEDVAEMEFKEIKLMNRKIEKAAVENPEGGVELAEIHLSDIKEASMHSIPNER